MSWIPKKWEELVLRTSSWGWFSFQGSFFSFRPFAAVSGGPPSLTCALFGHGCLLHQICSKTFLVNLSFPCLPPSFYPFQAPSFPVWKKVSLSSRHCTLTSSLFPPDPTSRFSWWRGASFFPRDKRETHRAHNDGGSNPDWLSMPSPPPPTFISRLKQESCKRRRRRRNISNPTVTTFLSVCNSFFHLSFVPLQCQCKTVVLYCCTVYGAVAWHVVRTHRGVTFWHVVFLSCAVPLILSYDESQSNMHNQ